MENSTVSRRTALAVAPALIGAPSLLNGAVRRRGLPETPHNATRSKAGLRQGEYHRVAAHRLYHTAASGALSPPT